MPFLEARRRILDPHNNTGIEMRSVDPNSSSRRNENKSVQQKPFTGDSIVLGSFTNAPQIQVDTFERELKKAVLNSKLAAEPRDTTLSAAELTAEIIADLSHNIPGLGAAIAAAGFGRDIQRWIDAKGEIKSINQFLAEHLKEEIKIEQNYKKFVNETKNLTHKKILSNTMVYILKQSRRRIDKAEQSIFGRSLQIVGSLLTILGLATSGATTIPGVVVGSGGTLIKLRVTLSSVATYFKKKWKKELHNNREDHARYLYGLVLERLLRLGYHSGDYDGSVEAQRASKCVHRDEINGGDRDEAAKLATEFLSQMDKFSFLRKERPTSEDIQHFISRGFWDIRYAIKT